MKYGLYEYFPDPDGTLDKVLIYAFPTRMRALSIMNLINNTGEALLGIEEINETAT